MQHKKNAKLKYVFLENGTEQWNKVHFLHVGNIFDINACELGEKVGDRSHRRGAI